MTAHRQLVELLSGAQTLVADKLESRSKKRDKVFLETMKKEGTEAMKSMRTWYWCCG